MAKAVTTDTELIAVGQHAAVVAAQAALAPLRAEVERLDREHGEAWRIGGFGNDHTDGARRPPTAEEVLEARARLAEIPRESLRARAKAAPAERTLRDAQVAARNECRERFHRAKRPLVEALDRALAEAARASDELAAFEDRESAAVGSDTVRFSWAEVSDGPDSRLGVWRRIGREVGLL
jgi:hypothetical protein